MGLADTDRNTSDFRAKGAVGAFLRLAASVVAYFQALGSLATLEAREAILHGVKAAILLVVALLFAAFGYVFFILFIAFLCAGIFSISWQWIALALALIHLGGGVVAVVSLRRMVRKPLFPTLAEQIRQDAAALRSGNLP